MPVEVIEGRTAQLGAQHPHTLDAKNNVATLQRAVFSGS
jgi:hypothetical protein